jgi:hypothetical protein
MVFYGYTLETYPGPPLEPELEDVVVTAALDDLQEKEEVITMFHHCSTTTDRTRPCLVARVESDVIALVRLEEVIS